MILYTIGHSNRTLEFFISLLQGYGIERLVDIRTIPRSRHNPQFNSDTLPQMLAVVGVHYTHLTSLGGLRKANRNSPNTGWTNSSFRGYADYMQTKDFEDGLQRLIEMGKKERLAIMCAEVVPWRCHRSLVSDALMVRAVEVHHIMSRISAPRHELTSFAVVQRKQITYPAAQMEFRAG